jgi:hypothetical protein
MSGGIVWPVPECFHGFDDSSPGGWVDFLSPAILLFSIGNIVTWTWTGYNMIALFAALQNTRARQLGFYEADVVKAPLRKNVLKFFGSFWP